LERPWSHRVREPLNRRRAPRFQRFAENGEGFLIAPLSHRGAEGKARRPLGAPREMSRTKASPASIPISTSTASHYFGADFDWRWWKAQAIAESGLDSTARS